MRTIKFRGKEIESGQWVYGFYTQGSFIGTDATRHLIHSDMLYDVIENTVCQFTGLTDKNGKEIYEGDIVLIPETENNAEITGDVQFDRGSYLVRSFLSGACHSLAWTVRERMVGEKRGEVIGNIHDNPELFNSL